MCPNLTEMDSPNGEINYGQNFCDLQINKALSGRMMVILPLVAMNYYFSFH